MDNRQRAGEIMASLARGEHQALFDALREDVTWRWMGVEQWSRTFTGKDEVIAELFGGVEESLEEAGSTTVHQILADGAHVVIEHSGTNQTPDGRAYSNNYCWVLEFDPQGAIRAVREYMDTQLVTDTFEPDDQS